MVNRAKQPFYDTPKWRHKRAAILRRDEYMCRQCKRHGKATAAIVVHHIYPYGGYDAYKYIDINLLSLCKGCHNMMHDTLNDELTELGKSWQERIKREIENISPPKKS